MSTSTGATSKPGKSGKPGKKPISPIWMGVIAFVVITGAMLANIVRECVVGHMFKPAWYTAFGQGEELAKSDKPAGIEQMEEAVAASDKVSGAFEDKLDICRRLANWYAWDDQYDGCRRLYLKALDYARQTNNMISVADVYADLALAQHHCKVIGDAEQNADKAIVLKSREIGADHANMGWIYGADALAATDAGHYKKAEERWQDVIRVSTKSNRNNGQCIIEATNGLACTLARAGQRQQADQTFLSNIKAADTLLGIGHDDIDSMICDYARALKASGDERSAKLLLTRMEDEQPFLTDMPRYYNL
jgi:tetratricopeptide (TPR) repeat protein